MTLVLNPNYLTVIRYMLFISGILQEKKDNLWSIGQGEVERRALSKVFPHPNRYWAAAPHYSIVKIIMLRAKFAY